MVGSPRSTGQGDPQPPPARTHPRRGAARAGVGASGGPYHYPATRASPAAGPAPSRAPRGAGRVLPAESGRRRTRSSARRPRRWAQRPRGCAAQGAARPPWPPGPASSSARGIARPPRRPRDVRRRRRRQSGSRLSGALRGHWGPVRRRRRREEEEEEEEVRGGAQARAGAREEVSVSGRRLLSPLLAPASWWRCEGGGQRRGGRG